MGKNIDEQFNRRIKMALGKDKKKGLPFGSPF
jgi:hypothetical protein